MTRRILLLALLIATPARAHEVIHEVARGEAVVVTFRTSDGIAMAFESFEVTAMGETMPLLRGQTDVEGRVVFVAEPQVEYHVRLFTPDGHGARVRVAAGTEPLRFASSPTGSSTARIALGAGLIVLLFLGLGGLARKRGVDRARS